MPPLYLPDDMRQQLNRSSSGMIQNANGPGVAVYTASGRHRRADIYLGLELDGFRRYRNISSTYPNIKMQFALKPVVFCQYDVIYFNPNQHDAIDIQVLSQY